MKRSVRSFSDWRQGSSAAADPASAEYNSENAQVYENGTLGPRPGWKEIAYSTGTRVHDDSSDGLRGIMWYQESDADENLLVVFRDDSDGDAWKFDTLDLETNTFASGQTLSDIANGAFSLYPNDYPGEALLPAIFDGSIMSAIGPHLLFAASNSPGTVAAVTTSDGDARVVTVNRERAYYWGINSAPGRIYFSDAADFSTIQSDNSFDVNADKDSYAGAPIGAWSVKNALLIACKDNRWLVLTGASPDNGSLKELGQDVVPVHGTSVIVDNQVWFLSPTGHGVVVATPSFVEVDALRYLSPLAYPGSVLARPSNSVVPKPAVGDDVNSNLLLPAIIEGDEDVVLAVERVNGVFNLSRWDTDANCDEIVFSSGRPNELYAARDANSDWDIFSRNHTLNRPANSGDTKSVSLANEAATSGGTDVVVDLGEVTAPDGKIVRPIKVVLDIDYWKGGNYSAPELAIDATVLGTESTTPEDIMAQETVTTTGWADTSGDAPYKRRVPVALPNLQFGTRFRIRLTYDNLALDGVQVYYDEQDDPR
jgi:hypothetical protein